ncbi:MAG: hypothetical protein H7Y41_00075 [Hyphomonadaceae bacterium]|nr:hypothetical protein [Clostridia bacterium]
MKKDKLTTLILTLLVTSSIVLTSQIWFQKKLWSNDYNFFVTFENSQIWQTLHRMFKNPLSDQDTQAMHRNAALPQTLVVNFGAIRTQYNTGSVPYNELMEELKQAITTWLKSDQGVRSTKIDDIAEWKKALKSQSLYVDFRFPYPIKTFGAFFGVQDTPVDTALKDMQALIVVLGDTATNDIVIYVKDATDQSIHKFLVRYDRTKLLSLMEKNNDSTLTGYKFSFELNFDEKRLNNVVLQSNILIPFNAVEVKPLRMSELNKRPSEMDALLRHFGHNPSNPRRFTETDNSEVYVENYSTFKISTHGEIDYDTIAQGKGVHLNSKEHTTTGVQTAYQAYNMAIDFIEKFQPEGQRLMLSNMVENFEKPGTHLFTFDYLFDGLPVKLKDANGNAKDAIKIVISNNSLTSYSQVFKKLEGSTPTKIETPIPRVMDKLITAVANANKEVTVEQFKLCYEDTDSLDFHLPQWHVAVKGVGVQMYEPTIYKK